MSAYYDTGVLLKLYTTEQESPAVQRFVSERGRALQVTELHLTEAISALRLKEFRGEATSEQVADSLGLIEEDLQAHVLRRVPLNWSDVWSRCQTLARTETSRHGTRTLDSLHVASALHLSASELVSTDARQSALARACGIRVRDPRA